MLKTLYMMVGVPGSGKSWFAQNNLVPSWDYRWAYISRDQIRFGILEDKEDYFAHEDEVYKAFVKAIAWNLNDLSTTEVIADATHLNWKSRRKLLDALAQSVDMSKVDVIPVVVTASLETCLKRNAMRTGREFVPKSVIRRMSYQLTDPKNDPYKYTAIMRVTNEQEIKEVSIHD